MRFVVDFSIKYKQLVPDMEEGQLQVEVIVLQSQFSFKEQFLGAGRATDNLFKTAIDIKCHFSYC